jgi:hypothetical protein
MMPNAAPANRAQLVPLVSQERMEIQEPLVLTDPQADLEKMPHQLTRFCPFQTNAHVKLMLDHQDLPDPKETMAIQETTEIQEAMVNQANLEMLDLQDPPAQLVVPETKEPQENQENSPLDPKLNPANLEPQDSPDPLVPLASPDNQEKMVTTEPLEPQASPDNPELQVCPDNPEPQETQEAQAHPEAAIIVHLLVWLLVIRPEKPKKISENYSQPQPPSKTSNCSLFIRPILQQSFSM